MFKVTYSKLVRKIRIEYNLTGKWNCFVGDQNQCEQFIYSGRFTDEQEEILTSYLYEVIGNM